MPAWFFLKTHSSLYLEVPQPRPPKFWREIPISTLLFLSNNIAWLQHFQYSVIFHPRTQSENPMNFRISLSVLKVNSLEFLNDWLLLGNNFHIWFIHRSFLQYFICSFICIFPWTSFININNFISLEKKFIFLLYTCIYGLFTGHYIFCDILVLKEHLV